MKLNIEKMINDLVFARRQEVINALNMAGIQTSSNITLENLQNLVMSELNNQNENLYITLGLVMDKTFDLSALEKQNFSNSSGTMGPPNPDDENKKGLLSGVNWGNVASKGVDLLGNFFGKKDTAPTYAPSPSTGGGGGGGVDTNTLLIMQQQQAARDEQRRREDAASRSTTFWVVGGIATVLVVGGIITTVIISKNKAKAA